MHHTQALRVKTNKTNRNCFVEHFSCYLSLSAANESKKHSLTNISISSTINILTTPIYPFNFLYSTHKPMANVTTLTNRATSSCGTKHQCAQKFISQIGASTSGKRKVVRSPKRSVIRNKNLRRP